MREKGAIFCNGPSISQGKYAKMVTISRRNEMKYSAFKTKGTLGPSPSRGNNYLESGFVKLETAET
jgi:hypothetical protein